jgi:glycerol-3-phosphate dehydrogenase
LKEFDVAIFGAGIIGTLTAWELIRSGYRVVLIEKSSDVANGATRANSGIIHSGIHEEPDSENYHFCREGIKWYREWSQQLDFKFIPKSTVILAESSDSKKVVIAMAEKHRKTLKPEILHKDSIKKRWPFLNSDIKTALEVNSSAIISPYETCRAVLENAIINGLLFLPDCVTLQAEFNQQKWVLKTSRGSVKTKAIILAAGEGTNAISELFSLKPLDLKYVSGAYLMFSKTAHPEFSEIIFSPPSAGSKGIVLQRTVHNNLMTGPDSIDCAKLTTPEANWKRFNQLWNECGFYIPGLNRKEIIRTFTGIRVKGGKNFIFENLLANKNLIRIAGIQSPGLTAAPAIATKLTSMIKKKISVKATGNFKDSRDSIEKATERKDPGELICRCEKVFMNEIKEAIKRGANSIESLRWQTRAGMGDCQSSFCRPALIKALKKELDMKTNEVFQKNQESKIFDGDLK